MPEHGNILGYLYGQESFSSMVKTETYVLAAPYSTIVGSMKQIIPGLTVLLEVARKFVAGNLIYCTEVFGVWLLSLIYIKF